MKRKALAPVAFPCGDNAFSTFCIALRVYENGRLEYTGLIRMPYSNRPKKGGGIAVPYGAINAPIYDKAQGARFNALRRGVTRQLRAIKKHRKTYKPPVLTGIQPRKRGQET